MNNLPWPRRLDLIRANLARQPGIVVVPKSLRLFGGSCTGCGHRIIAATGTLKEGMCGPCFTAFYAVRDDVA